MSTKNKLIEEIKRMRALVCELEEAFNRALTEYTNSPAGIDSEKRVLCFMAGRRLSMARWDIVSKENELKNILMAEIGL